MKSVLADTGRLVGVTQHEMIHVQQTNADGQTVLEKCITKGAADFLTYLLLNKIISPRQHAYGNAHQKELYQRLLKEQDGDDISYWMYNGEIEATGVPFHPDSCLHESECSARRYYEHNPLTNRIADSWGHEPVRKLCVTRS